jgi:hypothetical protein
LPSLQLLRPECSRFITQGLDTEIYRVIERLINTIGSPQIAIDERHTPKLYSRFLASLLAKHKRDGAAALGHRDQQGPPTQQVQTGSGAPAYRPSLPQPQASHGTGATGVRGAKAPDLPPTMALSSGDESTGTKNSDGLNNYTSDGLGNYTSDGLGNYTFDASPDFTFGVTGQHDDLMDFAFDSITVPGNDDMLAAMQAIQSPNWLGNMLMPGSVGCLFRIVLVRLILTSLQVLLAGGRVDAGLQWHRRKWGDCQ